MTSSFSPTLFGEGREGSHFGEGIGTTRPKSMSKREFIKLNDMSSPDSQHIQDKIKDLQRKRLVIAAAEEQLNNLLREDPDKVSASSTGQKRVSKLSKTKKPAG